MLLTQLLRNIHFITQQSKTIKPTMPTAQSCSGCCSSCTPPPGKVSALFTGRFEKMATQTYFHPAVSLTLEFSASSTFSSCRWHIMKPPLRLSHSTRQLLFLKDRTLQWRWQQFLPCTTFGAEGTPATSCRFLSSSVNAAEQNGSSRETWNQWKH